MRLGGPVSPERLRVAQGPAVPCASTGFRTVPRHVRTSSAKRPCALAPACCWPLGSIRPRLQGATARRPQLLLSDGAGAQGTCIVGVWLGALSSPEPPDSPPTACGASGGPHGAGPGQEKLPTAPPPSPPKSAARPSPDRWPPQGSQESPDRQFQVCTVCTGGNGRGHCPHLAARAAGGLRSGSAVGVASWHVMGRAAGCPHGGPAPRLPISSWSFTRAGARRRDGTVCEVALAAVVLAGRRRVSGAQVFPGGNQAPALYDTWGPSEPRKLSF